MHRQLGGTGDASSHDLSCIASSQPPVVSWPVRLALLFAELISADTTVNGINGPWSTFNNKLAAYPSGSVNLYRLSLYADGYAYWRDPAKPLSTSDCWGLLQRMLFASVSKDSAEPKTKSFPIPDAWMATTGYRLISKVASGEPKLRNWKRMKP